VAAVQLDLAAQLGLLELLGKEILAVRVVLLAVAEAEVALIHQAALVEVMAVMVVTGLLLLLPALL
jgi:hypothetical protein